MQKAKPTDTTGVPVVISVVDSNGNFRTIGTAATDASGMFTYAWSPDIEGAYIVIATFAGTNSYYGSQAESSFYAVAAPATATPAPSAVPSMADQYFIPAVAALAILIVVVGVALMLVLRKHP
jgi:hypothetical protein